MLARGSSTRPPVPRRPKFTRAKHVAMSQKGNLNLVARK